MAQYRVAADTYERTEREKAMARVRTALEALQRRVAQGKLKAPEKVGAAAARILGRHHGHRYYGWEYADGAFRFFDHPENLPREDALEGTYVLQTTEAALTPVQAVTLYKRLSEVERAFCHLGRSRVKGTAGKTGSTEPLDRGDKANLILDRSSKGRTLLLGSGSPQPGSRVSG